MPTLTDWWTCNKCGRSWALGVQCPCWSSSAPSMTFDTTLSTSASPERATAREVTDGWVKENTAVEEAAKLIAQRVRRQDEVTDEDRATARLILFGA